MKPDSPTKAKKNIHEEVRRLLPWYVTRSLPPDESALVENHVAECQTCSKELSSCQLLAEHPPELAQTWSPSPSHFAGILSRIDKLEEAASSKPIKVKTGAFAKIINSFSTIPRAFQWTLALETAACFALVLALASSVYFPGNKSYQTLSDNGKAVQVQGIEFRLLFADDMTAGELAALLKQTGAQIRQGPSQVGSYVVEVSGRNEAEVLSVFRANSKVRLAQKIDSASAE